MHYIIKTSDSYLFHETTQAFGKRKCMLFPLHHDCEGYLQPCFTNRQAHLWRTYLWPALTQANTTRIATAPSVSFHQRDVEKALRQHLQKKEKEKKKPQTNKKTQWYINAPLTAHIEVQILSLIFFDNALFYKWVGVYTAFQSEREEDSPDSAVLHDKE